MDAAARPAGRAGPGRCGTKSISAHSGRAQQPTADHAGWNHPTPCDLQSHGCLGYRPGRVGPYEDGEPVSVQDDGIHEVAELAALLLAPQARTMTHARRTRARQCDRRLPPRGLRTHRPRDHRPGTCVGSRRSPGRGPDARPPPPPGLLRPRLVHRFPNHGPHRATGDRRGRCHTTSAAVAPTAAIAARRSPPPDSRRTDPAREGHHSASPRTQKAQMSEPSPSERECPPLLLREHGRTSPGPSSRRRRPTTARSRSPAGTRMHRSLLARARTQRRGDPHRQETVFTQLKRIGELMDQLRDVEQSAPRTPPQPSAPRTRHSIAAWTG